jgi:hypothetical protein
MLASIGKNVLELYNNAKSSGDFAEKECLSIAKDAADSLNAMMLWFTHDIYTLAREQLTRDQAARSRDLKRRRISGPDDDVEDQEREESEEESSKMIAPALTASGAEVSATVTRVVEIRNLLIQVLCDFIDFGDGLDETASTHPQMLSESVHDIHRVLQRHAFAVISTIRALFPSREGDSAIVAPLAYTPNADVLGKMRKAFEHEGNRLRTAIAVIESEAVDPESSAKETDNLNMLLVDSLLRPLSSSVMFDVENLNRRQAATVISHLLEPNETVQETVKAVMHRLKEGNMVKYLEVIMISLRGQFLDRVVGPIKTAKEIEDRIAEKKEQLPDKGLKSKSKKRRNGAVASQESESGGETEAVEAEIAELEQNLKDVEDTIGHGYATVKMFADKLAKSLGVGKFKDVHLPALQDFCFAIIDLAFADDDNMSIVAVLEPFVRLLTAEAVDAVRDKLDGKISDDPQLADALSSDRLVTGASVYVSSCIDAMCWLGTWAWRWRR